MLRGGHVKRRACGQIRMSACPPQMNSLKMQAFSVVGVLLDQVDRAFQEAVEGFALEHTVLQQG